MRKADEQDKIVRQAAGIDATLCRTKKTPWSDEENGLRAHAEMNSVTCGEYRETP